MPEDPSPVLAPILNALPASTRVRQLARVLILLAPLAILAGLAMRWTRPAPPPLAIEYDRQEWVDRARNNAQNLGSPVDAWAALVKVNQRENAARRYSGGRGDSTRLRERLRPPASISVIFTDPDGAGKFEASFNPAGDLLEWSIEGLPDSSSKEPAGAGLDGPALATVEAWLRSLGTPLLTHWPPVASHDDDGRHYRGDIEFAEARGETFRLNVVLRGKRIRSASIAHEESHEADTFIGDLEQFARFCGFTLSGFFLLYSLRLYRRRRREGEIPRERALLLVVIFGLCGGLFVALNPQSTARGGIWDILLALTKTVLAGVGTSLLYAFGGLFVSAAYASGEGEIREGWPGKLVSFDALLAGKWFTRPVGRSALVAAVVAAWMFFLSSCCWRLEPASAALLIDNDLLSLALGRNVLIRGLFDLPLRVSLLIVAGLFMPLAFLHRHRWKGRKAWLLIIICPLLVDIGFRSFALSGVGPIGTSLAMVVAITAPFYLCDVLAAVLGALLFNALDIDAAMTAAVPAIAGTSALLLAVVAAALIPLLVAAWKGAPVDERTVLPQYARNLDERLSLQAEVSSAREAQLRLLPLDVPRQPGLSVAAYCQPAGVVGGDFYDFFRAPDGRLAIFVASGSGLGMASALTIALAKGFLASEIRRGESPAVALQGLLSALSGRVGAAADRTGLLLLIVDSARGRLVVARRGKYPALWFLRDRSCHLVPLSNDSHTRLETGTIEWRPGDGLIVHTEGLTALLDDHSLTGQGAWLQATARRTAGLSAGYVGEDLTRRLGGRKGKRLRRLHRDLTTLVLRNEPA